MMGFKSAGADVSDCQQFCYRVWRQWDDTLPTLGFILLCADAAGSDQTTPELGSCLMRAVDKDYGAIEVAYLFSRRVVDLSFLSDDIDAVGDVAKAQGALLEVLDRSSMVICAWGDHPAAQARADVVLHDIAQWGYANNLYHLGLNKDGSPKDLKQTRGRGRPARWRL